MNEQEVKVLLEQLIKKMSNNGSEGVNNSSVNELGNAVSAFTGNNIADDGIIPDIRLDDYTKKLDPIVKDNPEEFLRIKQKTDARIGVGRSGPRYKTNTMLRMYADHAGAIDAVLCDTSDEILERNNLFTVQTMCKDKNEYLARPDFGRQLDDDTIATLKSKCQLNPEVQVIVADGLSSTAVSENIDELLPALEQGFKVENVKSGTPFFLKYARVPAMDVVSQALGSTVTIMLVGERPGLATYSSLSAYIIFKGYPGVSESARTVISNIHRNGTNPIEAGAHIASVVRKILDQQASGTDLEM